MAELWLDNPRRKRRRRTRRRRAVRARKRGRGPIIGRESRPRVRVASRKRGRLRPRSPFKGMSINRRASMANPRRRRRRRSRNRRKRSFRRRSFRRNPPTIQTLGTNLGWAAAGFMTTKFVGNMVGQFMPGLAQQGGPLMRMGIKLGIAYVSAWGLEMAFGRRVFTPTFVGGSIEVIQDAVRTFISPMVPQLAAAEYPLEFYYDRPLPPPEERMGAYYEAEFETTAP